MIVATKNPTETALSLTETLTRLIQIYRDKLDSISLTETLKRETTRILDDTKTFTESLVSGLSKLFTESITLDEVFSRERTKVFQEFFSFGYLALQDGFHLLLETEDRIIISGNTLLESIDKTIGKPFFERLTILDVIKKKIARLWYARQRNYDNKWFSHWFDND